VIPRYYPYPTRTLLELFEEGALDTVVSVEVEPEYGYATRITYTDGGVRMTRGNDLGLNPSGACDVARDKAHTKFFLESIGIRCPRGSSFVLPTWAGQIGPWLLERGLAKVRGPSDALSYVQKNIGYPNYVKPNEGSQGLDVHRCDSDSDVTEAMIAMENRGVRVAVIEEAVEFPDFRIVVLDGVVISAYSREPLTVIGTGDASVDELLLQKQASFKFEERDTRIPIEDQRIDKRLKRLGLTRASTPGPGERLCLLDQSNLSLGGEAKDLTKLIDVHWENLAVEISTSLGLRFCGVDLALEDIENPDSDYSVLEVNSAPGLDHYAAVGVTQEALVRALYARLFCASPKQHDLGAEYPMGGSKAA
jgi:D-alanine-D-alanine ligase-like ATP-grasp enzyme